MASRKKNQPRPPTPKEIILCEFPRLRKNTFKITSSRTVHYNCIAFAAGDIKRCWWPHVDYYWPKQPLPSQPTLAAFVEVFQDLGYDICTNRSPEAGCTKVAIYGTSSNACTHAAIQAADGIWRSKLGRIEDISHELSGLTGGDYGDVLVVMKRAELNTANPSGPGSASP